MGVFRWNGGDRENARKGAGETPIVGQVATGHATSGLLGRVKIHEDWASMIHAPPSDALIQADDSIDLKSIFQSLRRQFRLIFLVTGAVMALALAYLVTVTPTYTAETLVFVDTSRTNLLDGDITRVPSGQADNARVESEVEILKSPSTALSVVDAANLVADPEFGPSLGLRQRILAVLGLGTRDLPTGDALLKQVTSRFQDALRVRRRGLTYMIGLQVTSTDPERAARLANVTAETYIAKQIEAKVFGSLAARDVIQEQVDASFESVARSDAALDEFIETNLTELEGEANNPRLAGLRVRLEAAQGQQLSMEVVLRDAQAGLQAQNYAALAERLGDAALANLAREQERLEGLLRAAEQGSAAEIELRDALAALEGDIEERAEVRLGGLRDELSGLDVQIGDLRGVLRQELLSADLSSESLARIFDLQQEAQIARTQYQNLLLRLRNLEAQASLQIADSRIVSPALVPLSPSAPNTVLILTLALSAGLGLGVALAFLNEYYIGGITSAGQLREVLGAPVATIIPLVLETPEKGHSIADKIVSEPLSRYSESIRRLRAGLDQGFRKRGLPGPHGLLRQGTPGQDAPADGSSARDGRVLMITSTVPAEGKTTLALALARIYAISGKKTLLIDADLRKPSVHRQTGATPEFGLLDYLQNPEQDHMTASFHSKDAETDLSLIMGAGRANVPTDQLISSATFDRILADAKRSFDIIVIDTSPLGPVVDARYIVHHADAVVMSVRYATTNQGDLRTAAGALKEAMAQDADFHTVLSHRQHSQSNYYDYKYEGYYT